MWPLTPVVVLSLAGLGAGPAGSDAIDGRSADHFTVDMAKADQAVLAGVQAFIGKGFRKAAGDVWVDQETGGLLKTVLDYEEDVYEPGTENVVGNGTDHIEVEVTQVGNVTVTPPTQ